MTFVIVALTLFTGLIVVDAEADAVSDSLLAKTFSPILVLTEDTGGEWGNIEVLKPEPGDYGGSVSREYMV